MAKLCVLLMAAPICNFWSLCGARTHNLLFDGAGPGHAFNTSRITLMAEEYGDAKFLSK
jgi:hypothetical protein